MYIVLYEQENKKHASSLVGMVLIVACLWGWRVHRVVHVRTSGPCVSSRAAFVCVADHCSLTVQASGGGVIVAYPGGPPNGLCEHSAFITISTKRQAAYIAAKHRGEDSHSCTYK